MRSFADRIAKLEASRGAGARTRRIVQYVLDCAPSEREARLAAIETADPDAFHIVRVVVRPAERIAA
ncbi:hypothetical protein B5U98_29430 [Bosea sp. Tri-39]|nr:hypothetical protein BLM15_19965 [Bosea sp. Tri-49]RXT16130.1 hypothetical protein B5U98_29430 [Bosea sp. Tri-39]RXT39822.1 hypothetical protein B5U99_06475 [Bosea sp. Tri-54]